MKNAICAAVGLIGGYLAHIFGGWDAALSTLCICMAADYITGVIVAAVFHNSPKTATGSLKSWIGFKGLCRKGMIMLFVLIGHRLDAVLGTNAIREGVIFGFLANEVLSLIENAGLMGLPLPDVIVQAVDVLANKSSKSKTSIVGPSIADATPDETEA